MIDGSCPLRRRCKAAKAGVELYLKVEDYFIQGRRGWGRLHERAASARTGGTVGEYDATTGAPSNANFITVPNSAERPEWPLTRPP